MSVSFRPAFLADIDWSRDPAPPSPAIQDAMDAIRRGVAKDMHAIIEQRARDMIAGKLPYAFCPVAAERARKAHGEAA